MYIVLYSIYRNLIYLWNVSKLIFYVNLDADRALRLLEVYHGKLSTPEDTALKTAIEKVIKLFRSKLFYALIGKNMFHCLEFVID